MFDILHLAGEKGVILVIQANYFLILVDHTSRLQQKISYEVYNLIRQDVEVKIINLVLVSPEIDLPFKSPPTKSQFKGLYSMSTGPLGQSHKIYDLTRLKNNSLDHPSQPQALPNESELSHLRQLVDIYRQHIEKISKMMDRETRGAGENSREGQLQTLSEDLDGIEYDLAALKESKVEQVPVIVEKIILIEKPVQVVRQIEVEVPVEREIIVEVEKLVYVDKIVEVEKPVFVEKIVEVEVEKPIYVEKVVRVQTPVVVERIIEQECPRCRKNGV